MSHSLAWQDHAVIGLYLCGVIALGAWLSRRQVDEDEYFLAGRRMPWLAVGLSLIASLLSSLTYLSEPGEVWQSGVTHMSGKMLAIPFEMAIVWLFCIPMLMRFRFTSIYEYLDYRFGRAARRLGVALFACLVVLWMGFIVLASSRVLADVTGMPLVVVIGTMGLVSTIYTVLGGLRAVIWTDVLQVALLVGGAAAAVVFVASTTQSGPLDWYRSVEYGGTGRLALFSADPFVRATVLTVALHMFVWHVATHTANQMTVQRYLSTSDQAAARRSFVAGSLAGVLINLLLLVVGLALFHYYAVWPDRLPPGVDPAEGRQGDRIFPLFVVEQLPPGMAGAVLAALLAAAMSSIDSGINSLATVLAVERRRGATLPALSAAGQVPALHEPAVLAAEHLRWARRMTLAGGMFITLAAMGLDRLTGDSNIVEMMPRSFNCFAGSLGGLFLIGMFMRRPSERTAVVATLAGLATSIGLAYGRELFGLTRPISFTWVMPGSLAVTLGVALVLGRLERAPQARVDGLTWYTRHRPHEGASLGVDERAGDD